MGSHGDFKTLGLPPGASWDEVKSAFRRLARTYHPDVAGPDGARKFTEITEAYMSLKEAISPGAASRPERPAESETYRAYRAETMAAGSKEPFWRRFWAGWANVFSSFFNFERREETGSEQDNFYDFSPARARFIGSAISRAESQMANLLSRRGEIKKKNRTNALLFRLRSRHPSVVLLALQQISVREVNDEIRSAVVEHFARHIPTSEVLENLLTFFSGSSAAQSFAKVLAGHAGDFSAADAQSVLRWLRRQDAGRDCFAPFLGHQSGPVIAAALNGWMPSFSLPDTQDIASLLKTEDDEVLVALLRLLKREKAPPWSVPQIARISTEHSSPAARVWASAIVRDRNLS